MLARLASASGVTIEDIRLTVWFSTLYSIPRFPYMYAVSRPHTAPRLIARISRGYATLNLIYGSP